MASLSKRAQARNERELQELLKVPGNNVCADCEARNPTWASWNIGVFVCMRCASLHRKLGTHISKVKSLSMDTWNSDQVENMRKNGNTAVNKVYNPKNKRPDIPIDADEADSAMERFIRKKYQEKSLVDGRPEPPSRADISPALPQSRGESAASPPPQLPPKKHKFFGIGLRASSDKKKGQPRIDSTFRIGDDRSPTSPKRQLSELELQEKLGQLHDMGFKNNTQNTAVLQKTGGDLERTIAALVKIAPSRTPEPPAPQRQTDTSFPDVPSRPETSNNPYGQNQSSGFGLSLNTAPQQPQTTGPSTNPWQTSMQTPGQTGLESQFQNMSVANPLFPNSTGGHATPQGYQQQTMTPPVPALPQQYSHASSPTTSVGNNPFYQAPVSAQSTGSNPFYQQQQQMHQPAFAPSVNPFFGQEQQNTATPNFGLPSPPAQQQLQQTNPFGVQPQQTLHQAQTFPITQQQQTQPQLPTFNYGQPQMPQFTQQQYGQQPQSPYQQNPQQPFSPQQTGRYSKNDIMSLFSQPAPYAQQPQLSTVPESYDDTAIPQQQISPAPTSNNPFGAPALTQPKRSATMPAAFSNLNPYTQPPMPAASTNPFFSTPTSRQTSAGSFAPSFQANQNQYAQGQFGQHGAGAGAGYGYGNGIGIGQRHTSNESVSVSHPSLMEGRHSPDAFSGLSARYG